MKQALAAELSDSAGCLASPGSAHQWAPCWRPRGQLMARNTKWDSQLLLRVFFCFTQFQENIHSSGTDCTDRIHAARVRFSHQYGDCCIYSACWIHPVIHACFSPPANSLQFQHIILGLTSEKAHPNQTSSNEELASKGHESTLWDRAEAELFIQEFQKQGPTSSLNGWKGTGKWDLQKLMMTISNWSPEFLFFPGIFE